MEHTHPSRVLTAQCGVCSGPVTGVARDHPDAAALMVLHPATGPTGRTASPVDVFHERCVQESEVKYEVALPRTGLTEAFLLHWTAHMMEKTWVPTETYWSVFVRRMLQDNPDHRSPRT